MIRESMIQYFMIQSLGNKKKTEKLSSMQYFLFSRIYRGKFCRLVNFKTQLIIHMSFSVIGSFLWGM